MQKNNYELFFSVHPYLSNDFKMRLLQASYQLQVMLILILI
ncbi:hypothetical protein Ctha_2715 [Chloroherpeton thalassium ATCC 35110]|uniref:Uncharacterized protein n=1 Tax=Chloroherpeton thalassium (strain ATCC 35110 / GB-78) TaxID=517418 RepID=B3QYU1_CHLT3|nr:hypothetical protein Ctha_2715 [Chloroherpeton thalassium ATCC 35110]